MCLCASQVLADVKFSAPRIPVYSNVTAAPLTSANDIPNMLARQLVEPVQVRLLPPFFTYCKHLSASYCARPSAHLRTHAHYMPRPGSHHSRDSHGRVLLKPRWSLYRDALQRGGCRYATAGIQGTNNFSQHCS